MFQFQIQMKKEIESCFQAKLQHQLTFLRDVVSNPVAKNLEKAVKKMNRYFEKCHQDIGFLVGYHKLNWMISGTLHSSTDTLVKNGILSSCWL